jgi:hypothetical protein
MNMITQPAASGRRLAFLLLCLVGATLALAQSASAAVPGLSLAAATSPSNSLTSKSATVSCPAGDQVLGVGGGIGNGSGQVIVDDWMQLNPTQAAVRGVEANPFASNWTAGSTAICAAPLAGRVQVIDTSAATTYDKYETATCPAGRQLVGVGADILGGNGDVMIEEMVPDLPTNSVTVLAHEVNPTPANWQARASAVCAYPLPGAIRVFNTSASSSRDSKTVTASCPAGTVVTGTGAETNSSGGEAGIESIEPTAFIDGVTARATEINPTGLSWTVSAFALCADA